ncbi:hypothetical protein ACIBQ1_61630 [Nonomuraea sp. NPDC050153]|uniref:hypothetical protein n=1 Tax=Nonomuraea sp. NPDC050153 TaxID=3364359 RepID=UPI0037BDE5C9
MVAAAALIIQQTPVQSTKSCFRAGQDRLRVSNIAGMFDAIEEFNEVIATERASGDPARQARVR